MHSTVHCYSILLTTSLTFLSVVGTSHGGDNCSLFIVDRRGARRIVARRRTWQKYEVIEKILDLN